MIRGFDFIRKDRGGQYCERVIRLRIAALRRLKEFPSQRNFLEYKKAEVRAKIELNKIKKESKLKFLDSLTKHTNPTYIWGKIKAFRNRWNNPDCPNEYNEETIARVYTAIDSLCPSTIQPNQLSFEHVHRDKALTPFCTDELDMFILGSRINSSPGIDGIDYKIIRMLSAELRQVSLELLNQIYGEYR